MPNPQHVVVIAFENRSFDHMLGFAPPAGPRLLPEVFQADTSSGPPLEALAPPDATVAGTRKALETVLSQTTHTTLASLSSHQRRLVELSDKMLKRLP